MSDTLNNVLNMHKIEEGKLELEKAPFSLVDSTSKVRTTHHTRTHTPHTHTHTHTHTQSTTPPMTTCSTCTSLPPLSHSLSLCLSTYVQVVAALHGMVAAKSIHMV